VELYRDGKRLRLDLDGGVMDVSGTREDKSVVKFAVHVLDLAHLPLGDGKKDHSRLLLKLGLGTSATTRAVDFPKRACDLSRMGGFSQFGPRASTGDRVPVFWMIGNTSSMVGANTPGEVVKANPQGDLAIVYIRLFK
jgi:hypothetical protein